MTGRTTPPIIGTKDDPKISPEIVRANPKQDISTAWRWGPWWELPGGRHGIWVVQRLFPVAIRLEHDPDVPLEDWRAFAERLEEARDAEALRVGDRKLAAFTLCERRAELRRLAAGRRQALRRIREQVADGRLGGPDDGAVAGVSLPTR